MEPLPAGPCWREETIETIRQLEARAKVGEEFAQLALRGWELELMRIREAERYYANQATRE